MDLSSLLFAETLSPSLSSVSASSSSPTLLHPAKRTLSELNACGVRLSLFNTKNHASTSTFPAATTFKPPTISLQHILQGDNYSYYFKSSSLPQQQQHGAPRLNLVEKLLGDVLVAATVTAVAAPFLTIIDKALVQYSAASHTLLQSAAQTCSSIVRHPIHYIKSPTFLYMWATYASTYATANAICTGTEHASHVQRLQQEQQQQSTTAKQHQQQVSSSSSTTTTAITFLGTTAVNTSASLCKDRAYARLFGSVQAATAVVPLPSYMFWMMRDVTVIGSSFVLPVHVAKILHEKHDMTQADALRTAQIATPVAAQLVAGPLHFAGLDWYNRPSASVGTAQRLSAVYASLVPVIAARMARILPGYGIAGVYNTEWRAAWREYLMQRQVVAIMMRQTVAARDKTTTKAVGASASSAAFTTMDSLSVRKLVELIRTKRHAE